MLVVEDEYFLADEVKRRLLALGAIVVGPVGHVDHALELIKKEIIDAAILDVLLGDELVFPVAERLDDREIPFVFATAFGPELIPGRFSGFTLCEKPMELKKIAQALWGDEERGLN